MPKRYMHCIVVAMLILSYIFPFDYTDIHAATNDYVVNAEILYLRDGPGLSYPIIATLENGQALSSSDEQGDWMQVTVDGQKGWVAKWLIKEVNNTQDSFTSQNAIVQVDRLNVRSEPSLFATVLTQLAIGTELTLLNEQDDWSEIEYGDIHGFVSSQYISKSDNVRTNEMEDSAQLEVEEKATIAENDPNTFSIVVDAVNIRKKASSTSKIAGVANKNDQYKVLSRKNNWVEIQYSKKKTGWIYSFYGTFTVEQQPKNSLKPEQDNVTIIYNGTNLRQNPSTSADVVKRVDAGDQFSIIAKEDDWYKINVDGQDAYVASWVVSVQQQRENNVNSIRKDGTLQGLTIVIDPGHGGNDPGTIGVRNTYEKGLTLLTAELLKTKLRAAGANVELTREADVYVDLRKRIAVGHQANADAFISLHYDANELSSVNGFTTYYYNDQHESFAQSVQNGLEGTVQLRSRGAQFGNYLVLRENKQPAILIELGYLSNAAEEANITTDYYREQATLGIYQGLLHYFSTQK